VDGGVGVPAASRSRQEDKEGGAEALRAGTTGPIAAAAGSGRHPRILLLLLPATATATVGAPPGGGCCSSPWVMPCDHDHHKQQRKKRNKTGTHNFGCALLRCHVTPCCPDICPTPHPLCSARPRHALCAHAHDTHPCRHSQTPCHHTPGDTHPILLTCCSRSFTVGLLSSCPGTIFFCVARPVPPPLPTVAAAAAAGEPGR
jgi:hypothetical protein